MKTVEMQIPSVHDLYNSLPAEFRSNEAWNNLVGVYSKVVLGLIPSAMAERTIKPQLYMSLFRDTGGRQLICNWSCSDLSRPVQNTYNWHLQETSQWIYAGAIVFDKEHKDFSIHT